MKKIGVLFIIFSILILSILTISADLINIDTANPEETEILGINPTDAPDSPEELQEQSSEYLKKEWGKILANNKVTAPILEVYGKISPTTDPIFRHSIGMEPSISWLFLLTFIIWISLVIYAIRIVGVFDIFSKFLYYSIMLGTIIIISLLRISKRMSEFIIDKIGLLDKWWVQLIVVFIVIAALVFADKASGSFSDILKALKKKMKKRKLVGDIEELKEGIPPVQKLTEIPPVQKLKEN